MLSTAKHLLFGIKHPQADSSLPRKSPSVTQIQERCIRAWLNAMPVDGDSITSSGLIGGRRRSDRRLNWEPA